MSGSADSEVEFSEHLDISIGKLVQTVSVTEGYERWASTYDEVPNPLLSREERYLAPQLTGLRGKSVLDLACGTARWLEKLLALGAAPGLGVDLSAAMLRVANMKSKVRGRLVQADCTDLPVSTAAFDFALCSFALGHIHDLESMVSELKRVMKVGGDVVVSDLHPGAYQLGWKVGFRDREASVQIEVQSHSTDEILTAFSANGFECVSQQALWLGQPEQALFARARKLDAFEQACQLPAIFACRFRRIG